MTPNAEHGLVCRYCGNTLVINGLRLVAATASGEAARICPNNRLGHDTNGAMTPCERCGEPTETALCDDCWKAYVAETVKHNVPIAIRRLGWQ